MIIIFKGIVPQDFVESLQHCKPSIGTFFTCADGLYNLAFSFQITNFENLVSYPHFDTENAYRKPPVIL
jgi:hypothetical protein